MKMTSLRQAFLLAAILAGTAALTTSPVLAQPAPGNPVCGSVASLMNHQIFIKGAGNKGNNFVSIPAVSPINNNNSPTVNGFIQICKRFGLSIPGPGGFVIQFNGQNGNVVTFDCSSSSAPPFTIGQGVLVQPNASSTGKLPGVECARPYTTYITRNQVWPTPITVAAANGGDICTMMGLPVGTIVTRIDANSGNPQDVSCAALQTPGYGLKIGEGLLIHNAPSTTTGTPVIF
jgi:hypothetical protein